MSEPRQAPRWRLRADWLALGFVGLALVLLLVAPLMTARRTAELRERIEVVAEPARDATTGVQFGLARQMSNLRGYLLTGDTLFLVRYARLREQQDSALTDIGRLADALGPEATRSAATLRERVRRWHERVNPGSPGQLEGLPQGSIPLDQRLYEQAVASAVELDQVMGGMSRDLRDRIRDAERAGFILSLILVAIALVATGVLVWFGQRLQLLADEAERQRHEAEMALKATREASQARDRVIRGVTHDVKNPLGAADGYAELLELGLKGALSAPQAEIIAAIRRSVRSALTIIEDLLDLARAERGELPFFPREIALDDLVLRLAESHRGAIEAAGHTLEVTVPGSPVLARTDPVRVEQVLGNLLSNAAKYGGRGGPIRVGLARGPEPPGHAVVVVRDSGPGIPADQLDMIFTEFHQVDPAAGKGHGLGLAIARHVARQLGGDLTALSAPGEGAAFTFRLPLDTPAHPLPFQEEASR